MGVRFEPQGDPTTVYVLRGEGDVDFEHLPHRLLAMRRERELIRELLPVHNVQGKPAKAVAA